MSVIAGLCAAGAAGGVVPGLDTVVGAVLLTAALAAVAVVAIGRELRIRRRVADTAGTRPAPRLPTGPAELRVGPGECTPVLPVPNARAACPPAVATAGRSAAQPAATDSRPPTSPGGAA